MSGATVFVFPSFCHAKTYTHLHSHKFFAHARAIWKNFLDKGKKSVGEPFYIFYVPTDFDMRGFTFDSRIVGFKPDPLYHI